VTHRPFQIGKSTFRLEQRASGWWLIEEFSQIDRRGNREDEWDEEGPFTEDDARARLGWVTP
jgi:hypothetical protein